MVRFLMPTKFLLCSTLAFSVLGLEAKAETRACQPITNIESACRLKLSARKDECPPQDCAVDELAKGHGMTVYALSTIEEACDQDCGGSGVLGKALYRLTDGKGEIITACYLPSSTRVVNSTLLIETNGKPNRLWPVKNFQTANYQFQTHVETITDIEIINDKHVALTIHTRHEEHEPDDGGSSGTVATESKKRFYFWLSKEGPLLQHEAELFEHREDNTSPVTYEGETEEAFAERLAEWKASQEGDEPRPQQAEIARNQKQLTPCGKDHPCPPACESSP